MNFDELLLVSNNLDRNSIVFENNCNLIIKRLNLLKILAQKLNDSALLENVNSVSERFINLSKMVKDNCLESSGSIKKYVSSTLENMENYTNAIKTINLNLSQSIDLISENNQSN